MSRFFSQCFKKLFVIFYRHNLDVLDCTRRTSWMRNIQWPKIQEFTTNIGVEKIREYLEYTALVTDHWYYNINLTETYWTNISRFYIFEVKFSIPTRVYPIPQVRVSIFFQYEISRVIPPSSIVKVNFKFEGSSLFLTPGKHIIKEKYLWTIAQCKLNIFPTLKW